MKKAYILFAFALVMALSVATATQAIAAPSTGGVDVGFQYAPAIGGGVAVGVPFSKNLAFASRIGTLLDLDGASDLGLQVGLRYYFNTDGSIQMFSVLYVGGMANFVSGGTTTLTFVGTLGAGLQYTTPSGAFASVEIDTDWIERHADPGYGLAFAIGKRF